MTSATNEVADAVAQRKAMLERQLLTAEPESQARIAENIESCRRLLVKLQPQVMGAIAEDADRALGKEEEGA
jgi:hypothetical protein